MAFSEAQYLVVIDKIDSGVRNFGGTIVEIRPMAEAALGHWYIPVFVRDAVRLLADRTTELAMTIQEKISELLASAIAPVMFFRYAYEWEDVRGLASGVTGELNPTVLRASQHWKGTAAEAYEKIITPQGAAAARISTIADKTSWSLRVCAEVSLAFYVAVGSILLKLTIAALAVIVALGSIAFSWAGVALAVEEVEVGTGLLNLAVATLVGTLGTQAQEMATLHGEAIDNSTFPGGTWPDPLVHSYSDGSVRDGDAAWSVAR